MTLQHQGAFQREANRAVAIGADNDTHWVVQAQCSGLQSETILELVVNVFHQDAPAYLVSQLRKLKLTKPIRSLLQQQYGMKIFIRSAVSWIIFLDEVAMVADDGVFFTFPPADHVLYAVVPV